MMYLNTFLFSLLYLSVYLTETYDVFKYIDDNFTRKELRNLTETYDVFK